MLAGSVASSYYGEPRSTKDVDFVVLPSEAMLGRLAELVGDEGYMSLSAAREALQHRSLFNVIDFPTGWKADLHIRNDRPHDVVAFERRRDELPVGVSAKVASPEDVLLSKLEWWKLGESEVQYRDASGIYQMMRGSLDEAYLDTWAEELGVTDLLRRVRESEA